ncbi:adenylate kinase [Lyngbya aestuarii]|uniref:adenylate kinase n=1 Tax=Lyngbya aestuarii TaxID=118322 RepID=UPI00403D5C4D
MTRLIFLGPPGAGKGTQAKILADNLAIPHISTGDILRSAMAAQTTLGQKAQSYYDKGDLVPDDLLHDLIGERLSQSDAQKGWILDGFPRKLSQASFLEELLQELSQQCDCALNLEVPDEVLIIRLLGRGRQDDNKDTIRRRLEVYRQETEPLIVFYGERSLLKTVNGDQSPEEVTESVKQAVDSCKPSCS